MHRLKLWLPLVLLVSGCTLCRAAEVELIPDPPPRFSGEGKELKYIIALDKDGAVPRRTGPADSDAPQEGCRVSFCKLSAAGDSPEPEAAPPGTVREMVMTNRDGRQYSCRLPLAEDANATHDDDGDAGSSEAKNKVVLQEKTPTEHLDALSVLCFHRIEDWWSYEFCYKKHVRQFHKEREKVVAEFSLGTFSAEASDTDAVKVDKSAGGKEVKYVRQVYIGGSGCDITGHTRNTEVRFVCAEDRKDSIASIKEPTTCNYVLIFTSPRLCKHPDFHVDEPPVAHLLCRALPPQEDMTDEERSGGASGASGPEPEGASLHPPPPVPTPLASSHDKGADRGAHAGDDAPPEDEGSRGPQGDDDVAGAEAAAKATETWSEAGRAAGDGGVAMDVELTEADLAALQDAVGGTHESFDELPLEQWEALKAVAATAAANQLKDMARYAPASGRDRRDATHAELEEAMGTHLTAVQKTRWAVAAAADEGGEAAEETVETDVPNVNRTAVTTIRTTLRRRPGQGAAFEGGAAAAEEHDGDEELEEAGTADPSAEPGDASHEEQEREIDDSGELEQLHHDEL